MIMADGWPGVLWSVIWVDSSMNFRLLFSWIIECSSLSQISIILLQLSGPTLTEWNLFECSQLCYGNPQWQSKQTEFLSFLFCCAVSECFLALQFDFNNWSQSNSSPFWVYQLLPWCSWSVLFSPWFNYAIYFVPRSQICHIVPGICLTLT